VSAQVGIERIDRGFVDGAWDVVASINDKTYRVTLMAVGRHVGATIFSVYWMHSSRTKTSRPCSREVKAGALFDRLRDAAIAAAISKRDAETNDLRAALAKEPGHG
jgi:hypothetical protein